MYEPSSPSMTSRRAHKWARVHGPSDQWRQRLLKSCISRMKDNRQMEKDKERQERLRKIVSEECNNNKVQASNCNGEDFHDLLQLLEEIDNGERMELENILQSLQSYEEEHINELEHFHMNINGCGGDSSENIILCPMCGNGHLNIIKGFLVCLNNCDCEFRMNCGTKDGIDLNLIRNNLNSIYNNHIQSGCAGKLSFHVKSQPFGDFLWACCSTCQQESIVL